MKTALGGISLLAIGALSVELFSINYKSPSAFQNGGGQNKSAYISMRCVLHTQQQDWDPSNPAVIYGTVENLSDGPREVAYWSELYLTAASGLESHWAAQGRFTAPVDLFPVDPLSAESHQVDRKVKTDHALHLKFKQKGDKVDFGKVDARNLIWASELRSSTPTLKLFAVVPPGAYDLQLVLTNESESCESAKIRVTILGRKRE
jgi:hypothetical protein